MWWPFGNARHRRIPRTAVSCAARARTVTPGRGPARWGSHRTSSCCCIPTVSPRRGTRTGTSSRSPKAPLCSRTLTRMPRSSRCAAMCKREGTETVHFPAWAAGGPVRDVHVRRPRQVGLDGRTGPACGRLRRQRCGRGPLPTETTRRAQVDCEFVPAMPDSLGRARHGIPVSVRGRLRLAGHLNRHPACDAGHVSVAGCMAACLTLVHVYTHKHELYAAKVKGGQVSLR